MNKILKLALVLFLVCAVTAGILGGINELTKDRIAEINRLATIAAYSTVLKADGYDLVEADILIFRPWTRSAARQTARVTLLSLPSPELRDSSP